MVFYYKRMMRIKKLYLYICIILFVSTFSCKDKNEIQVVEVSNSSDSLVVLNVQQQKTAGIKLGSLSTREIKSVIQANGYIHVPPANHANVSFPYRGIIKAVEVLEGLNVKRGQLLATIENPDFIQFQQDYLEAVSQTIYADEEFRRQEKLASENVNTQKTYQLAKANYVSWLAKQKGLEEKLSLLNLKKENILENNFKSVVPIYAPIDGIITEVNVNLGKSVAAEDKLFEIVNTKKLIIQLAIFENDYDKIKLNQLVKLQIQNQGYSLVSKITHINSKINDDRTINVFCELINTDSKLIPNAFVNASIEVNTRMAKVLPLGAVAEFQGKKYIIKYFKEDKNGNTFFQFVKIDVGEINGDFAEIIFHEDSLTQSKWVINGAHAILAVSKNNE